jgi:alkylation response protein AidB-like acyl-CoA dehydrogenase
MRLTPTAEQQELRQTVRRFFADTDSSWKRACTEIGVAGLAVPEEHGGAGFGFTELGIVLEEAGRALYGGPLLSSTVMATRTLLAAGSTGLLPALATGERTATVAHGFFEADGDRVTGSASLVPDGDTADLLLVPVGDELWAVDGSADGVHRVAEEALDLTRRLGVVRLDGAPGTRLTADGAAAVEEGLLAARIALAADAAGGIAAVLDLTVEHARNRRQFGQPIGGFQAVKHHCADIFVAAEVARTAAGYAVRVLDTDDPAELALAAALAKSSCTEAYVRATGIALQVHGGIGFTWDHPLHRYLKRAKTDQLLFGDPTTQRARLADLVGI